VEKLWTDIENLSPLGAEVHSLNNEFAEKASNESILAQDANKLELLFFLKEQHDLGNPRALEWLANAEKALTNQEARSLAKEIKDRKADQCWKMSFVNPAASKKE
jgi:DNA-binding SARP family transcriptional activator